MKIFLKSLLLALLLLGAFGGLLILTAQHIQARPTNDLVSPSVRIALVNTAKPAVVQLLVEAPEKKPVIVQLKNDAGVTLWEHHLAPEQTSFRFKLNLTEIPDGRYTVVVINGKVRTTHAVQMSTVAPSKPTRQVVIE